MSDLAGGDIEAQPFALGTLSRAVAKHGSTKPGMRAPFAPGRFAAIEAASFWETYCRRDLDRFFAT